MVVAVAPAAGRSTWCIESLRTTDDQEEVWAWAFIIWIVGRPGKKYRVLKRDSLGSLWSGTHQHMAQIPLGNSRPVLVFSLISTDSAC